MNIILSVITGFLGLATGVFIPFITQKTIEMKYAGKNKPIDQGKRYTGSVLTAASSIYNLTGWAVAGLLAKNILLAVVISLIWTMLLVISWIDLRIHRIPNEMVLL